jgi:hypothetical protein
MSASFYCGLDLGQSRDWTALAIVQRHVVGASRGDAHYQVRHLERPPLGTSYPDVVELVAKRLRMLPPKSARLVIDATGVGAPVVDMVRRADLGGIEVTAVTITGGNAVHRNGHRAASVPKRDLVSTLQVLLQSGRLKIAEGLPLARLLSVELLNFRATISLAGHDSYGAGADAAWREAGTNDDLVLAVALSCWVAESEPSRGVTVSSYLAPPEDDGYIPFGNHGPP